MLDCGTAAPLLPWPDSNQPLCPAVLRGVFTALPTKLHGFLIYTPALPRHPAVLSRPITSVLIYTFFNILPLRRLIRHHLSPTLSSALHYYLSVQYVAVSQQPSRTSPWCLQIRKLPLTLAFFFVAVLTALFHAVFFLATRDWSLSLPFQLRTSHGLQGFPVRLGSIHLASDINM